MQGIYLELYKLYKNKILLVLIAVACLFTMFESYLGYLEPAIADKVFVITGLSWMCDFYALFIAMLVYLSNKVEKNEQGYLNYYLHRISKSKILSYKYFANLIIAAVVLVMLFVINWIFLYLRSGLQLEIIKNNILVILLLIGVIALNLNIMYIIEQFIGAQLLVVAIFSISLIGSYLVNSIYWLVDPFLYFTRILNESVQSYANINLSSWLCLIGELIISAIILRYLFKKKGVK